MILTELRDYLKQQHRVSLKDLMTHFNSDADTLRAMLAKWINKGKVKKLSLEANCGTSCCRCDSTLTELYEWLDN
ncbi:MAG: FeoC-like transcriptional regulator [Methylococcaceae bacterium]